MPGGPIVSSTFVPRPASYTTSFRILAHPRRGEGRWGPGLLQAFAEREALLTILGDADRSDAIGSAVAFLLQAADQEPDILRAVLRTHVERVGVTGRDIIDVLNGIAGKG